MQLLLRPGLARLCRRASETPCQDCQQESRPDQEGRTTSFAVARFEEHTRHKYGATWQHGTLGAGAGKWGVGQLGATADPGRTWTFLGLTSVGSNGCPAGVPLARVLKCGSWGLSLSVMARRRCRSPICPAPVLSLPPPLHVSRENVHHTRLVEGIPMQLTFAHIIVNVSVSVAVEPTPGTDWSQALGSGLDV